jgi:2-keto-4-pentenoate hydratase/2-oxohepta-3-ene-1,7-dioic acid hydratase in catechol pathway
MRHVRFSIANDSTVRNGTLEGDLVREYVGNPLETVEFTNYTYRLEEVYLQAPLIPRHIIGIGKNFVAEGDLKPEEPELPILFFKPLTTVIGPGEPILLPPGSEGVKFESEIAVIIGRSAKRIRPEEADDYIFGYTIANDVGAFDYFHPEGHWTVGKSFDTFCPLGPYIETEFDYRNARIRSTVNGTEKQNSLMEQIIMPIDRMISCISRFMTLMPGDVILTGTPAGADMIRNGDTVECTIEGLGSLINPVRGTER